MAAIPSHWVTTPRRTGATTVARLPDGPRGPQWHTRGVRIRVLAAAVGVLPLVLAGCGEEPALRPPPVPLHPAATVPPYDDEAGFPAGQAALSLVPAAAEVVTITDFDEARTQLGVPELTSEDLMTDRTAFWERAPRETVLLAGGMLLPHTSELMLDHGFTQDDVDWEAHFTTPSGPGWILGFRPDLDMTRVEGAVDAGVAGLGGADVDADRHLASVGMATSGETWGDRPGIADLTNDVEAESTYYRSGCVPLAEALGPDAGAAEQEAVVAAHDPADLGPLDAFGLSFVDGLATARLGLGRGDLFDRSALAADFPTTGPTGFADGFDRAVVDPSSGRIGYTVVDTAAAAALTLTDALPFAVCDEVRPMEVPTGL